MPLITSDLFCAEQQLAYLACYRCDWYSMRWCLLPAFSPLSCRILMSN